MRQGDADGTQADTAEGLALEMAAAWRRGERHAAEHYLDRHPELLDPPEGAVRLIYEEVCLRREHGRGVPGFPG